MLKIQEKWDFLKQIAFHKIFREEYIDKNQSNIFVGIDGRNWITL